MTSRHQAVYDPGRGSRRHAERASQLAGRHPLCRAQSLERTKVTVVVNDKSTESGQIFVRRDEKMRIEMTKPDPKTILRSGNEFYIYTPKINRVEEYDLGKKQSLVDQYLLLGFGTSGSSLKKSYLVTFQGEELVDSRKVLLLELTPISEEVRNQISKIHMWIDESNWLPVQQKFFGDLVDTPAPAKFANEDRTFHERLPQTIADLKAMISASEMGNKEAIQMAANAYIADMQPILEALDVISPAVQHV